MAISSCLSVSTVPSSSSLTARSHYNYSKLSSISSLQFPARLHRLHPQLRTTRISSPSISRRLPLLVFAAKKQTFNSFDELLQNSDKPVLVDFYATWCGPCQLMGPVLNDVGAVFKDTLQVVKIDTEKYPTIADKYSIEALPAFILFKDEKPYDCFEGALTKDQLIQRIENSLNVKQ